MSARTDVHRPAVLKTEDYEFAFCDVHHPKEGEFPNDARFRIEEMRRLLDQGFRFADVHGPHQCSHCGTRINYYAVLKHLPTKTLIHVGETCLDNRFELASGEFHALRRKAQLDRAAQRFKALREAWAAEHPDEAAFLGTHTADAFYSSLRRTLYRYGSLTERQLAALQKAMERDEQEASGGPVALVRMPDFEGRTEITGRIEAIYWKRSDFGRDDSRHVMTVVDDRHFKVWGSVPATIDDAQKGDRVSFMAAIERSEKDETFGFFKRPTKAVIVDEVPA